MRTLFGSILIGCGLLVAGLSGLCLLVIAGNLAVSIGSVGELYALPAMLIFAGVPLLVGIAMFILGRRQIRKADEEAQERIQSDIFE